MHQLNEIAKDFVLFAFSSAWSLRLPVHMASIADYEAAGVPAQQLGWSSRQWTRRKIVTILHHFGVFPHWRRRYPGSKLELMRRLDEVTQRHHLTTEEARLILFARRPVEPNGSTPLEGSQRIAWARRLEEANGFLQETDTNSNASASNILAVIDDDGGPSYDDEGGFDFGDNGLPSYDDEGGSDSGDNGLPSYDDEGGPDSGDDGGLSARVALTRATTPPPHSPPIGRISHSHSSSDSVNRFSPYGGSERLIERPTIITQPTSSSSATSEPATGTLATSRPTREDPTARGPYEMELRAQLLEQQRTSQLTSSSSATNGPAMGTLATTRPTSEDSSVRELVDRVSTERDLQRLTTIEPTTSSAGDSGAAVSTLTTGRPTSENYTINPSQRECSVCLESLGLDRFPKRNITSTCNHAPDVCLSCLAQSIATQVSTKVWDQIDCPTCSERLQHTDVKEFASSVIFGKYV